MGPLKSLIVLSGFLAVTGYAEIDLCSDQKWQDAVQKYCSQSGWVSGYRDCLRIKESQLGNCRAKVTDAVSDLTGQVEKKLKEKASVILEPLKRREVERNEQLRLLDQALTIFNEEVLSIVETNKVFISNFKESLTKTRKSMAELQTALSSLPVDDVNELTGFKVVLVETVRNQTISLTTLENHGKYIQDLLGGSISKVYQVIAGKFSDVDGARVAKAASITYDLNTKFTRMLERLTATRTNLTRFLERTLPRIDLRIKALTKKRLAGESAQIDAIVAHAEASSNFSNRINDLLYPVKVGRSSTIPSTKYMKVPYHAAIQALAVGEICDLSIDETSEYAIGCNIFNESRYFLQRFLDNIPLFMPIRLTLIQVSDPELHAQFEPRITEALDRNDIARAVELFDALLDAHAEVQL